jgi:hypothetical protein
MRKKGSGSRSGKPFLSVHCVLCGEDLCVLCGENH